MAWVDGAIAQYPGLEFSPPLTVVGGCDATPGHPGRGLCSLSLDFPDLVGPGAQPSFAYDFGLEREVVERHRRRTEERFKRRDARQTRARDKHGGCAEPTTAAATNSSGNDDNDDDDDDEASGTDDATIASKMSGAAREIASSVFTRTHLGVASSAALKTGQHVSSWLKKGLQEAQQHSTDLFSLPSRNGAGEAPCPSPPPPPPLPPRSSSRAKKTS